jgi:hypothetical protein
VAGRTNHRSQPGSKPWTLAAILLDGYTMRLLIYFISLVLLTGCSDKAKPENIAIGNYSFTFPHDFDLNEETGIDSYVGKIKGDSIEFAFDYGRYSDSFTETTQEYLDNKFWLHEAGYRFLKEGITYDINNYPKVELLHLRQATKDDSTEFKNVDFVATCKHDSLTFDYPIFLPDKIKRYIIKIDTIQNHLRKIIIAKDPLKGLTGIYLKDLKGSTELSNNTLALSMATRRLTKAQQDTVLKVFSTVRIVDPK